MRSAARPSALKAREARGGKKAGRASAAGQAEPRPQRPSGRARSLARFLSPAWRRRAKSRRRLLALSGAPGAALPAAAPPRRQRPGSRGCGSAEPFQQSSKPQSLLPELREELAARGRLAPGELGRAQPGRSPGPGRRAPRSRRAEARLLGGGPSSRSAGARQPLRPRQRSSGLASAGPRARPAPRRGRAAGEKAGGFRAWPWERRA